MAEMHLRLTTATQTVADLPAESALPLVLQSVDSVTSYMGQTLTSLGHSHLLQQPRPQSTPQFSAGSSSGSRQRQVRPPPRPFRPPVIDDSHLIHPPPRPPPRQPPHSSSRPRQPPPRPPPDVPSPPPIQYTYRRSWQRQLDDIEENVDEGASSLSSAARGKRDRRS